MPETQTRVPHDPATARITIAATLVAATEAARRIDQGHTLTSPAGYIRTRTDRIIATHATTWHACLQADPTTPAETLAYGTIDPYTTATPPPPATTRTLADGTTQRFIPGTGWATEHASSHTRQVFDDGEALIAHLHAIRNTTDPHQEPRP